MKTDHLLWSFITILLLTFNCLGQGVTCPSQTLPVAGRCVLTANVTTLTSPIELPPNSVLDCQGNRIRPSATPALRPQVAIFLNNARNILIRRCIIEDFDFGVFAINSKRPELPFQSFAMVDNTITARYTGISLMAVDNAEIINNVVTYSRGGGKALYIGRDSDSNGVSKNTFISAVATTNAADIEAFRAPGTESKTNPKVTEKAAVVVIAHVEGPEPTLQNVTIGRRVFQVVNHYISSDEGSFTEANRFEGNTIRFLGIPLDAVALTVPHGTHIIGNTIERGSDRGIRLGSQVNFPREFPGRCTLISTPPTTGLVGIASLAKPSRACLDNSDCNRFAANTIFQQQCSGVFSQQVLWTTNDTLIEGNVINGPFNSGIDTTGWRTRIIGNTVIGPLRDSSRHGAGIRLLGRYALESAIVMRNSVSNVRVALGLVKQVCSPPDFTICAPAALSFDAQVSLNDFNGDVAVRTTRTNATFPPAGDAYDLMSELSVFGGSTFPHRMGNFWGRRDCMFPGAQHFSGAPNPVVTDGRSYSQSIANSPNTPSPCQ